jgi:ABC-type transport system substrate-binding protein
VSLPFLSGRSPHSRFRATRTAVLAVGIALVLSVAACSDPTRGGSTDGAGPGGEAAADTKLNAYLYQAPKPNWSPMAPAHGPDQIVMSLIYDSLLGMDDSFALQPRLAATMPEVSDDGMTITFTLKDGLTWSDGTPLTAEDVVFTYNLMANPATGSSASARFANVEGAADLAAGKADAAAGFSAPDEKTFVVKTTKPDLGFIGLASNIFILPQHILGDVPPGDMTDHAFFTKKPDVGAGPYTSVEFKTDQYVHLTKNPNYREGEVAIDDIYLRPVTSDVATAQLGTGEMDLVQISPADVETVEALNDVEVTSAAGAGFIRTSVNQTKPYLRDKRLRQAMMYAIDRRQLVDKALAGKASVLTSSFMGDALPDDVDDYAYDPERARKLLADMGWDADQVIELAWIPGQRDRDTAATVVESQLEAVGIKLKLRQVQPGELTEMMQAKSYDMVLFGGGNYKTEPWAVYPIDGCDQHFPAGGNLSFWCDEKFDALMKKANTTVDETERYALYQQAARIENDAVPYIWLYNPDTVWAHTSRLKGFVPSGDFTSGFWNVEKWSLDS